MSSADRAARIPARGVVRGHVVAAVGILRDRLDEPWTLSARVPRHRASPLRKAGAQPVQDPHPHDRGPKGTCQGAVISNGNLYCPATPRSLLTLGPLARDATPAQAAARDAQAAEAARYKLGRVALGLAESEAVVTT